MEVNLRLSDLPPPNILCVRNLPVCILGVVCLLVYGLATARFFRHSGAVKLRPSKLVIFMLFMGMVLWMLGDTMLFSSGPVAQAAAVVLACASLGVFFWAYRQHGAQKPGRVFSPDVPALLITSGPYARVRHPIYLAYLLYLLGLVIGTQSIVAAVLWLIMAAMYRHAARQEDDLLANSAHAEVHRRYMRQSGQLLPWNMWRRREV